MKWISVDDELSEQGDHVLIAVDNVDDTQDEPYVMMGYRENIINNDGYWHILTENTQLLDRNIGNANYWQATHWMPLPEPPTK